MGRWLSVIVEGDFKTKITSVACKGLQTDHITTLSQTKCCWFECLLCLSVQNKVFYLMGNFGNFFFGR